jgi:hypothetical protein
MQLFQANETMHAKKVRNAGLPSLRARQTGKRMEKVEIGSTRLLESTTSLSHLIFIVALIANTSHISSDCRPGIARSARIYWST